MDTELPFRLINTITGNTAFECRFTESQTWLVFETEHERATPGTARSSMQWSSLSTLWLTPGADNSWPLGAGLWPRVAAGFSDWNLVRVLACTRAASLSQTRASQFQRSTSKTSLILQSGIFALPIEGFDWGKFSSLTACMVTAKSVTSWNFVFAKLFRLVLLLAWTTPPSSLFFMFRMVECLRK